MPAKSEKQAIAARIARGIQKGEVEPKAGTASAEMAKMKPSSLKHYTHTEEKMPKLKELVKKVVENIPQNKLTLNGKEVDVSSIELDDVDIKDYPDFSDARISAAYYVDGTPLTSQEIEKLENENYGLVNNLAHDNLHEERDWLNNPAIERDFEKSDVSPEEYERERLGRYGRGSRYSGGYSSAPNMVGITFFDVPSGKEEVARKVGLTQLKSGKWGFKHRFDKNIISVASDREKSTVSAAEAIFGKGRYWEPKK